MNEPLLLTIEEAAVELFGEFTPTSRNRMYKFIKQGKLKALKDGRIYWISRGELQRISDTKKEGAG